MSSQLLRAAIVGCGVNGVGRGTDDGSDLWFTHAGAYHRHPRVRVVAAADISPERRERCRRVWGIDRLYDSADALLDAEQVDVLSVCTPDDAHPDVALAAIAAGVPAVFCEKPIAATVADAERMVDAARRRGVVLAVNHHRRWEAGHREARAIVARGELGGILSARVLFAGGLRRVGTHAVDLLRYFFGDVTNVLAATVSDGTRMRARLEFSGGVEAALDAWPKSGAEAFDLFELDVVGTRGRILVADLGARIERWCVAPSDEYGGNLELSRYRSIIASDMRSAFLSGVDAVITARATDGRTASSGEDGLAALRVLEAIDAAARATAAVGDTVPQ